MIARFAAILAAIVLSATPLPARPISEDEKRAVAAAVQAFGSAMIDKRYSDVFDRSITPRMLKLLATKFKVPEDQVKLLVVRQLEKTLEQVVVEAFSMDAAKADYRELSTGEPFGLLPTTTTVKAGGARYLGKEHTVALFDEGRWFLVRVTDKPQIEIRETYPAFSAIDFPGSSTEILGP